MTLPCPRVRKLTADYPLNETIEDWCDSIPCFYCGAAADSCCEGWFCSDCVIVYNVHSPCQHLSRFVALLVSPQVPYDMQRLSPTPADLQLETWENDLCYCNLNPQQEPFCARIGFTHVDELTLFLWHCDRCNVSYLTCPG